jgi:hypothetical protein
MASITFWLVSIPKPTADYADANEVQATAALVGLEHLNLLGKL